MAVKINKGRALGNIHLMPLIDVVFLLLIFFLVATRFAEEEEREMDIALPNASEAQPLTSKPGELFININQEGRYFVTGKILTLEELERTLKAATLNHSRRVSVIIRADKRVVWSYVVAAMNACNKAKIRDYRVTTLKGGT